jgi:hypothetical protein
MKLTEQELAQIFQESSNQFNHSVNVADCLTAPNVSKADAIVSDFNAAQATKLAIHMKPWSEQVGHELSGLQRTSWSQRIHQLFTQWMSDTPVVLPALAVVFTLTAVVFLSNHQMQTPATHTDVVTNDVINSLPFEGNNDRLSKAGFDGPAENDRLFDANFS